MIVGVTGRKRSGKDSFARHLINEHKFVRYQMAGPLKDAVAVLFGWDRDILDDGPEKEEVDPRYGISPRQAMQFMGAEFNKLLSEWCPEYGKTTGIELYRKRLEQFVEEHPTLNIVVPDIRMPYEVQAIRNLGGIMVRVKRGESINTDGHDTERHVDTLDVNVEIANNGTLEDLYENAEMVVQYLRTRTS